MWKGRKLRIYEGERFNRLTVVAVLSPRSVGHNNILCLCDCGEHTFVHPHALASAQTTSCGCRRRQILRSCNVTHGHSTGRNRSPEYSTWRSMLDRCRNKNCRDYPWYGGRGISVDHSWERSFASFLRDVGPRPGPKYSLDRIDNNGGYYPGNVRWATAAEQSHNSRACKLTTDDATQIRELRARGVRAKDVAARFGVTHQNVRHIVIGRTWKPEATEDGNKNQSPNTQPGLPGVEETP